MIQQYVWTTRGCPSGSDDWSIYSQTPSPTVAAREAIQAEYRSLDTVWSTFLMLPGVCNYCIRNVEGTFPSSPLGIHLWALCPLIHLIPFWTCWCSHPLRSTSLCIVQNQPNWNTARKLKKKKSHKKKTKPTNLHINSTLHQAWPWLISPCKRSDQIILEEDKVHS